MQLSPSMRPAVAVMVLLALLASGCGSNRTAEDIALAAQGGVPGQVQADGGGALLVDGVGGADTGGVTGGAAIAPSGPSTAGAGPVGTSSGTASAGTSTSTGPGSTTGTTTGTSAGTPGSGTAGGGTAGGGTAGGGGGAAAPPPAPGGGAAPADAPAAAGPKSRIRIGVVGALSGPAGAVLAPIPEAVQVWAADVNARGGVNGHPVEVLVADDGGDPRRQREIAQDYVENQGVIAFVGNPSALSQGGSIDYLESVGVPLVGSDGALDFPYETTIMRPQQPHGTSYGLSAIFSVGSQAQAQGLTRWGSVTCVELASCQQGAQTLAERAPQFGAELVYSSDASLVQPDFTAECLNAQAAGVQMLHVVLDAASLARLSTACARQGFSPIYSSLSTALVDSLRNNPDLDGMLIGAAVPLWTQDVSPAVAEFRRAFATYAPGATIQPSSLVGWTAARFFEAAAVALPEPATPADVIAGMDAIGGNDLGGLTYPLAFTPGEVAPRVHCWFEIQIQGGEFVTGPAGPGIQCE